MPELNRYSSRHRQDAYVSAGPGGPDGSDFMQDDPAGNDPIYPKKAAPGWQLVAVQGISCAVILLIVLVFRLIGGEAFVQLRQSFNKSIMSNSFIATLTAMWNSTPGDDDASTPGTASSGTTAPSSTQAEPSATGTQDTLPSGTTAESDTPSAGGNDAEVSDRRVLYAPEGASFLPLTLNRVAARPLASGTVTSYFGYRTHPVTGKESFHLGLDIAALKDTPIAALFFGVVSEVGYSDVHGHYVKLSHSGGLEVMYAHCSEILVAEATVIKAGEIVAHVGSTGVSTGNHLHIEVRKGGIAYDPNGIVPLSWYD